MQAFSDTVDELLGAWGFSAVDVLVPIGILFGGWILALLIAHGVRRLLAKSNLDQRLAELLLGEEKGSEINAGRFVGRFVYWVLMLFVLGAFLVRLQLAVAAEPINAFLNTIFEYAPRVIGALCLLLLAWIIARVVRSLVLMALERTKVDEKLAEDEEEPDTTGIKPSQAVAESAYWVVFLLFLPAVLGVLELKGILGPVQAMLDEFLGFVPNLISAGVIFVVGWFAARVVQRIVQNLLSAAGVDRLSQSYGVDKALSDRSLSELAGLVVQVLVIIPVTVAALNALQIEAVTSPASAMLGTLLGAFPSVLAAALVLTISFFIGKFIAGLVENLLSGAGFDRVLVRIGLAKEEPSESEDKMSPSRFAGVLVLTAVMLFATIEAAGQLGFDRLAMLVADFITLAGHVGLGVAILALGLLLAGLASQAISGSEVRHAKVLSNAARFAIIILAGAMGLRQMGLANEIIVLAFAIPLAAVAVAFALAFGLGAREEAADIAKELRQKWGES